jgi:hypothetical protein
MIKILFACLAVILLLCAGGTASDLSQYGTHKNQSGLYCVAAGLFAIAGGVVYHAERTHKPKDNVGRDVNKVD